ncbi:MAG: hypothetical protein R3F47_17280 [Gammaproteobacteria bacterium]|jgi:hypothetical protein
MPRIQFTVTLMKLAAALALLVFGMGVLAPQPLGPVPAVHGEWRQIQTP